MAPLRVQFASVAALMAAHLSFASCDSSERRSIVEPEKPEPLDIGGFFGGGSFAELDRLFQQSMSSLFGVLGPMGGMMQPVGADLSVSLAEGDERTCQFRVKMGDNSVSMNSVTLGVDYNGKFLLASIHREQTRKEHGEKGESLFSRSFHVRSTVHLPERCIATPGVLLASLAGYMVSSSGSEAMVVFPSTVLLNEGVEKGLLPENIAESVTRGDQRSIKDLTSAQQCLAAGFTVEQCSKLGETKPQVSLVKPTDGGYVPVPRFDVELDVLN